MHSWLFGLWPQPCSMNSGFDPDLDRTPTGPQGKDTSRIAYNHAQYLPHRHRMMQAWADYLDSLRKETQKDSEMR